MKSTVVDCHDPMRLASSGNECSVGMSCARAMSGSRWNRPAASRCRSSWCPSKTVKNRVHLDIDVGDLAEATAAAVAAGATVVGKPMYDELGGFQVMADPEGNEFCLINGPTAITA